MGSDINETPPPWRTRHGTGPLLETCNFEGKPPPFVLANRSLGERELNLESPVWKSVMNGKWDDCWKIIQRFVWKSLFLDTFLIANLTKCKRSDRWGVIEEVKDYEMAKIVDRKDCSEICLCTVEGGVSIIIIRLLSWELMKLMLFGRPNWRYGKK